jgi:D-aspartate ligase
VLGEIDLLRALHVGGIRCVVAAQQGEPARYSRAAERVVDAVSSAVDPKRMLDRLISFAAAEPQPPILFFDSDFDLLLVSRERGSLGKVFRFFVPDAALLELVVDKSSLQDLATRLELPVPPARVVRAGEAVVPDDLELTFPLTVKPLTRTQSTWRPLASTKAVRVDSADALKRVAAELAERSLDAIVQEAVPGGEDRIESYHVYIDEDGEVAGEFTGRKLRTFPAEYGYTTALVITNQQDVRELGREVMYRLGLRGVAKLDFKRAPDGRLWLLDVNPRFNLWHYPGALAGVNLPLLVYCDLVGIERPPPMRAVPGVRWCTPRHDFQAARAAGWGVVEWLRFAARCEGISGFAASDPLPLARAAAVRAFQGLRNGAAS